MTRYRINEIFRSLQGEGYWTGTPMLFLRMAGCNLRCPFCDTDFEDFTEMTADDIISALKAFPPTDTVCITGGEPTLQIDAPLIGALHKAGYRLHIETNGTRPVPDGIDWITLSPKRDWIKHAGVVLEKADEVKLVFTGQDISQWASFPAKWHFLQPCSGQNMAETAAQVLADPVWRLSLQTHKIIGLK